MPSTTPRMETNRRISASGVGKTNKNLARATEKREGNDGNKGHTKCFGSTYRDVCFMQMLRHKEIFPASEHHAMAFL